MQTSLIFFNDWAVATFVCAIFMALLSGYVLVLKNKANYTRALFWFLFGGAIMNTGFFIGASLLIPEAAYHRFLTVLGSLLATPCMVRFGYQFPLNRNPKESLVVLVIATLNSVIACSYFFYQALQSPSEFLFNGEIFNFPSEIGRHVARAILFNVFLMMIIMIRKIVKVPEGTSRSTMTQMLIAMLIPTLVPGIANLLFQRGAISHAMFQQIFFIGSLLGYFTLTLVFINNTVDRTSFMTKIVGISLVSILLVVQALSTVINYQTRNNYHNFHQLESSIAAQSSDISALQGSAAYVVSYPLDAGESGSVKVLFQKRGVQIDTSSIKKDLIDAARNGVRRLGLPRAENLTDPDKLYQAYLTIDEKQGRVVEVGFPYSSYRKHMHQTASLIIYITGILTLLILLLYPLFFSRNLVQPLNSLLKGVGEVNEGNLEVKIPVLVQDEIGYLSENFNGMVRTILKGKQELQHHADTLEEKVKERTREVTEKMEEIQALKVQQDGDYYLTALIGKPLMTNWNKSRKVSTEFLIEQKKKFSFRERNSELGGDLCISGNLRFGTASNRYIMFCNADAMGKSMQGAGGAIVMGTAMNNIMARSASGDRVLTASPKEWLRETYEELHNIFLTFDGSMTISAVIGLIEEASGKMYFFNAEHPWMVLYRQGRARFMEHELKLRKLGSNSEFDFYIDEFQLQSGDIIFAGSDGRDDLDLTPAGEIRNINEDHELFLKHVENGAGRMSDIARSIKDAGELTDDFSLVRIGFEEAIVIDETGQDVRDGADALFASASKALREGRLNEAIDLMKDVIRMAPDHYEALYMLARTYYDHKNYDEARHYFEECLEMHPHDTEVWFPLSVCYKISRQFELSRDLGERIREDQPHRLANLVNLGDCYRLLGERQKAQECIEAALNIDPSHTTARRVAELLEQA